MSEREQLLKEAEVLVTGDRNEAYGPPGQDFARTAALWTLIFEPLLKDQAKFEPHHVAMAMIQLKASRMVWTPGNRDHWVDIAGYAACGWECAVDEARGA